MHLLSADAFFCGSIGISDYIDARRKAFAKSSLQVVISHRTVTCDWRSHIFCGRHMEEYPSVLFADSTDCLRIHRQRIINHSLAFHIGESRTRHQTASTILIKVISRVFPCQIQRVVRQGHTIIVLHILLKAMRIIKTIGRNRIDGDFSPIVWVIIIGANMGNEQPVTWQI